MLVTAPSVFSAVNLIEQNENYQIYEYVFQEQIGKGSTTRVYRVKNVETDELFAVSFSNPDKTIEQCITYILETVQKSGCCGYTSDEVFAIATHFWDEKDIVVGNPINCRVVINEHVEF